MLVTISGLEAKSCRRPRCHVDTLARGREAVQALVQRARGGRPGDGSVAPVSAPVAAKLAAVAAGRQRAGHVAHRGEVPGVGVVDGTCCP